MKSLLPIIGILFTFSLNAQINLSRELKFENPITDITAHVYSIYTCTNNHEVFAWKVPIIENEHVNAIALNPTGRYIANAADSKVQVWRIDDKITLFKTFNSHKKPISSICFSPQGTLASAAEDLEIHITDFKQNKIIANFKSNNGLIKGMCFNSSGTKLYAANDDGTISLWNMSTLQLEKLLQVKMPITSIAISSDDAFLTVGGSDGSIKIMDSSSGEVRYNLNGHVGGVNSVAITRNGFYAASVGNDNKLIIWSLRKGTKFKVLENYNAPIRKAIFLFDNDSKREYLLTGGDDKTLRAWETTDLPLPYDYIIKNEIQHEIANWEKKLENESLTQFQERISYSNKAIQVKKIQNSIVNKYALKNYSFANAELSSYNKDKETFSINFNKTLPINLKIPKNEAENFSQNFKNLKPANFQFVYNDEDFKLSYLELKNTIDGKVFYYDESGIKTNELYRIEEIVAPPAEVIAEVANRQDTLKGRLTSYIKEKKNEKIISENVDLNVNTSIVVEKDSTGNPELNYHVEYSYEVIKATVENQTDDFPLGKYKLTSSNAARITVQILKETIEKELIKYIKSGMDVTVKITGSTDGTPIVNAIPYADDFGDFEDEPYFNNNNLESMSLTKKTGIKKNEQLAFLRTYGVRKFILDYIEPLNKAKLHFQHYTFVAKEKGSQYRKISIELVLHGVFKEFKEGSRVLKNKPAEKKVPSDTLTVDNATNFLPPILSIQDISFSKNSLRANEAAVLSLTLKNIGPGDAKDVFVNLSSELKGIKADPKTVFPVIARNGGVETVNITIQGEMDLPTSSAVLKIEVVEPNFKVKIQGKQVKFPTREFLKPELIVAKFAVVENLSANPNNQIDINEQIDVKFALQNVGQGDADNVRVSLINEQKGVMFLNVVESSGKLSRQNPSFTSIGSGKFETLTFRYFVNSDFTGNQLEFKVKAEERTNNFGFAQTKSVEINKKLEEEGYIRNVASMDSPIKGKVVIEDIPDFISDVDENIPANSVVNDKIFAVVIGNEVYSKEIKVKFALNDARILKQYLVKTMGLPLNNIHYIENATYGQILDALKWINEVSKAYKGQARIIFYYAGHGMPEEQSKNAFILPVDGNSQNLSSAVKLSDIYAKLTEFPSLSVTAFLDACFSGATRESNGTMLAEGRGVKIKPKDDLVPGNLVVFSAATGDETAFPYYDKQHGMFTYFLLKKIQETKGDATLSELKEFITTNVTQQSVVVNKKSQTPQVNTGSQIQDAWNSFRLK